MTWTTEQILSLAPDPSSASAGRGLSAARHWVSGGSTARAIWGECQGSGSRPYQVQIDLHEPAFHCSCPSRKFPCKHGIGLFLLWASEISSLKQTEQPEWVNEWLAKRDAKSEASERPAQKKVGAEIVDPAAQEKRAADREARVASGIEELDLWLCDLIRSGLAAVQSQPVKFWQNMAARMVDAQAPGFARRIREMAVSPASGAGWEGRLLEQIALLRLLMEGYRRIESQSAEMQATIRSHVGWTIKQEELLLHPGVRAEWLVVGKRTVEEDKLTVQRTWLLAAHGSALLLNFAVHGQPMEVTYAVGSYVDAELVYFPRSLKQRAAVKTNHGVSTNNRTTLQCQDFECVMHLYAFALASDPWVETVAVAVRGITPVRMGDLWSMCDGAGFILPIDHNFQAMWRVLAFSGGHPITLFAEWDGCVLSPLSVANDERFISFL